MKFFPKKVTRKFGPLNFLPSPKFGAKSPPMAFTTAGARLKQKFSFSNFCPGRGLNPQSNGHERYRSTTTQSGGERWRIPYADYQKTEVGLGLFYCKRFLTHDHINQIILNTEERC